MAAAAVSLPPAMPEAIFQPIIQGDAIEQKSVKQRFDPKKHLAHQSPEKVIMMKDIGYSEDTGVSPVAVSDPFPLFSADAIQTFRDEVLNQEVLNNCMVQSTLAACQVRGYVTKYAPFTYDAWTNPATLSIVSKIAGVELVPSMNLEISHVNISVKSERESQAELAAVEQALQQAKEGGSAPADEKPVVGWHTDSYPFVCVTMLSDCTGMVGGETALRTASGDVMKVRGPQMGCAVVLQGRYITHQALRALGAQERITMVTSFRPKSPHLPDDSVLTTVRGISELRELYYGFAEYRLQMIEERVRKQLKNMRDDYVAGKPTNTKALKKFLAEQEAFIRHTNDELVPDEEVIPGHQPELGLPDVDVAGDARKQQEMI